MMLRTIREEIERLVEEDPELRKEIMDPKKYAELEDAENGRFRFGTVADNRDPQCRGWLRVACDMIAPGAVTPWVPMIAVGATKKAGWWQLPDIGTQVLLGFVGKGHSHPVVLGCIYDEKHWPPEHPTSRRADSVVYQTRKHRMEFVDEGGKERLTISSARGKMMLSIEKNGAMKLINELGDIRIRCRKLTMKGGNVGIKAEKGVRFAGRNVSFKAGNIKLKCENEVTLKAPNININGRNGVTTSGKQVARAQDKVMGFDIHQTVIPAPPGSPVTVPLPHPFIGKITEGTSPDVKINGYQAATKGSTAKHDDPTHMQLPGTIQFQSPPGKKGEVTGGTSPKFKINGKEAAVMGSTVSTCNDMGMRDGSAIIAPGAAFPMPAIIHPKNTQAWNEQQAAGQTVHPELARIDVPPSPPWEGEKARITVFVKDIADGNAVTFLVFFAGQNPDVHIPAFTITKEVEGGTAGMDMCYDHPAWKPFPAEDPGFFVMAHSAWCPPVRSGNFTVRLKRPEIQELKAEAVTYDDAGNETGSEESDTAEYGGTVNVRITGSKAGFSGEKAVKISGGEGAVLVYCKSRP